MTVCTPPDTNLQANIWAGTVRSFRVPSRCDGGRAIRLALQAQASSATSSNPSLRCGSFACPARWRAAIARRLYCVARSDISHRAYRRKTGCPETSSIPPCYVRWVTLAAIAGRSPLRFVTRSRTRWETDARLRPVLWCGRPPSGQADGTRRARG